MTKYSQFISNEIGDINNNYTITGLGAGTGATTVSHNNVALADVRTISHNSDSGGRRIVQVTEFTAGDIGTTNTSLDFDLADEGSFIQEDADNGTDFAGGVVKLAGTTSTSITARAESPFTIDGCQSYSHIKGNVLVMHGGSTSYGKIAIYEKIDGTWTSKYTHTGNVSYSTRAEITQHSAGNYGDSAILDDSRVFFTAVNASNNNQYLRMIYRNPSTGSWGSVSTLGLGTASNRDMSIAADGDTVVVWRHDGTAQIYKNASTATSVNDLVLQDTITSADTAMNSLSVNHLAIGGDTLVFGSGDTRVYIFERNGDAWEEAAWFVSWRTTDRLGRFVAVDPTGTLVAASSSNGGTSLGQGVSVYRKTGNHWIQEAMIPNATTNIYWGDAGVAIEGNLLAFSAYGYSTSKGRVYIYKYSEGTWSSYATISSPTGINSDQFGRHLSMSQGQISVTWGDMNLDRIDLYEFGSSYTDTQPYYVTTSDDNHLSLADIPVINSCTITNSQPAGTTISGLVSFDGRSTWSKWTGTTWSGMAGGLDNLGNGNIISEIETGLANLTTSGIGDYLDFAFDLNTTAASVTPEIDQIALNYDEAGTYRTMSPDEYDVDFISDTETKVTKKSAGTSNLKVVVRL